MNSFHTSEVLRKVLELLSIDQAAHAAWQLHSLKVGS